LARKTRPQTDLLLVDGDVKLNTLTHPTDNLPSHEGSMPVLHYTACPHRHMMVMMMMMFYVCTSQIWTEEDCAVFLWREDYWHSAVVVWNQLRDICCRAALGRMRTSWLLHFRLCTRCIIVCLYSVYHEFFFVFHDHHQGKQATCIKQKKMILDYCCNILAFCDHFLTVLFLLLK